MALHFLPALSARLVHPSSVSFVHSIAGDSRARPTASTRRISIATAMKEKGRPSAASWKRSELVGCLSHYTNVRDLDSLFLDIALISSSLLIALNYFVDPLSAQ